MRQDDVQVGVNALVSALRKVDIERKIVVHFGEGEVIHGRTAASKSLYYLCACML